MTNSTEQITTEHTLYAEPIFHFGNFTVTNSLLNTWLVVLIVIIFGLYFRSKIKLIPSGIQNFVEAALELLFDTFDSVTGSREKTLKLFPFVFTFFVFILLNNWLGLLPGIGSVGQVVSEHGEKIFVHFSEAARLI